MSLDNDALCFEEIEIGKFWISPARTVTESDVVAFAGLTGDYNPLHTDHEFAKKTPFRRPIAHGLLGLSWVAGLGHHSPFMRTAAFLRIVEWQFLKPIFFGDTVHVRTEIISMEPTGRKRGLVVWKRQLINQNGDVVQEGTSETLVERRVPLRTKG